MTPPCAKQTHGLLLSGHLAGNSARLAELQPSSLPGAFHRRFPAILAFFVCPHGFPGINGENRLACSGSQTYYSRILAQ